MQTLVQLVAKVISVNADDVGIPKAQVNQGQVTSMFNMVLGLAGAVAVIFVILGGIRYATSQGDPSQTKKAKETIIYALVGLGFIMFSFIIVQTLTAYVF